MKLRGGEKMKYLLVLILSSIFFVTPAFASEGYYTQSTELGDEAYQFITQSECVENCATSEGWAVLTDGTTYHATVINPASMWTFEGENAGLAVWLNYRGQTEGTLTYCFGTTNGGCELGTGGTLDSENTEQSQQVAIFVNPYSMVNITDLWINFTGTGTKIVEPFNENQFIVYSWTGQLLVDDRATQLVLNGTASIKDTLFSIAEVVWPYALAVGLFFLAIRFGMKFFRRN